MSFISFPYIVEDDKNNQIDSQKIKKNEKNLFSPFSPKILKTLATLIHFSASKLLVILYIKKGKLILWQKIGLNTI